MSQIEIAASGVSDSLVNEISDLYKGLVDELSARTGANNLTFQLSITGSNTEPVIRLSESTQGWRIERSVFDKTLQETHFEIPDKFKNMGLSRVVAANSLTLADRLDLPEITSKVAGENGLYSALRKGAVPANGFDEISDWIVDSDARDRFDARVRGLSSQQLQLFVFSEEFRQDWKPHLQNIELDVKLNVTDAYARFAIAEGPTAAFEELSELVDAPEIEEVFDKAQLADADRPLGKIRYAVDDPIEVTPEIRRIYSRLIKNIEGDLYTPDSSLSDAKNKAARQLASENRNWSVGISTDGGRVSIRVSSPAAGVQIERSLNTINGVLEHTLVELRQEYQGRGIANHIMQASLDLADVVEINKIKLDANLDVGGYAWIRKGAVPNGGYAALAKILPETFRNEWRQDFDGKDFKTQQRYVLSKEFADKWKQRLLNTSWTGSFDPSDEIVRTALTKGSAKAHELASADSEAELKKQELERAREAEAREKELARQAREAEIARQQAERVEREQLLARQAEQERLRKEAEAAERQRVLAKQAEETRLRKEAEAAERERLKKEAEIERERLRKEAAAAEAERVRAEKVEQERLRKEAEAAERERLRAEKAERERLEKEAKLAEKERLRKEKIERDRLEKEAELAERERLRIKQAKAAEREKIRREAEEERLRIKQAEVAEKERLRQEAEAEKARIRQAEAAEKERLKKEAEAERLRAKQAEEAERLRAKQAADAETERLRQEAERAREKRELERRAAVEREEARKQAEAEKQALAARQEAERRAAEAERARQESIAAAQRAEEAKRVAREAEEARRQEAERQEAARRKREKEAAPKPPPKIRPIQAPPRTANERIFDRYLRHQIELLRYANGLQGKVLPGIKATEQELYDDVVKWVVRAGDNRQLIGAEGRAWQADFERVLNDRRKPAWDEFSTEIASEFKELAALEVGFAVNVIEGAVPVSLNLTTPPVSKLVSIVNSQPFQGRTLKEWADKLAADDVQRILNRAKVGIVQGQTPTQIAREISPVGRSGTFAERAVARKAFRDTEAVILTLTNGIQNEAKQALYEANADIIEQERYVATLDARTTPVCRGNDGQIFPRGQGPIPPLHFRCRSLRVPNINPENLGNRPFNPTTERQLLDEYAAQASIDPVPSRADLPRGHKTTFDKFGRKRTRELVGQVPATTSYNDWLAIQSNDFQDFVLGKTRAQAFRSGNVTLDQFVNDSGRSLTIKELRSRGLIDD